jgi:Xaa-Pro aminopeptidase
MKSSAGKAPETVLAYRAMRIARYLVFVSLLLAQAVQAQTSFAERRHRAATAFRDGVLLLHTSADVRLISDGFRQDPLFYYFTGLENTLGAVLGIDGKSGESWLFLSSNLPYKMVGLEPEAQPGAEDAKRLGIEHVVGWAELEQFLAARANQSAVLYYAGDSADRNVLPKALLNAKAPEAPLWLQTILQKWPAFEAKEAKGQIQELMEVQTPEEIARLRRAAATTVSALLAGMKAIHANATQRSVELAVQDMCWNQGAHGVDFWPWAMAGVNAVFPRPFFSPAYYDHLNRTMLGGELVRLDVGCEWEHYQGDLGRTVPVSGHYDDAQRETWTIFVAAYKAGVKALREGMTEDQIFDVWQKELLTHRMAATSALAQRAIDLWSDRKKVPFWQIHTTNLVAGHVSTHLRAGMTINLEPIASVDGQGFFLEDMYLIKKDGAELLTPGVPYSAEEIEAAMR